MPRLSPTSIHVHAKSTYSARMVEQRWVMFSRKYTIGVSNKIAWTNSNFNTCAF